MGSFRRPDRGRQRPLKKGLLKLLEKRVGNSVTTNPALVERHRARGVGSFHAAAVDPSLFDVTTPSFVYSSRVPGAQTTRDTAGARPPGGILGMGELSRRIKDSFSNLTRDPKRRPKKKKKKNGALCSRRSGMLYARPSLPHSTTSRRPASALLPRRGPFPATAQPLSSFSESSPCESGASNADANRGLLASRFCFLRFILGDMAFDRKYIDELRSADSSRTRNCRKVFRPQAHERRAHASE